MVPLLLVAQLVTATPQEHVVVLRDSSGKIIGVLRASGVIEGEVLTPAFIERVLDTVCVPDAENRLTLEADAVDLERQIANLTAAVKAGGDIPSIVEELKRTNARHADVRRRLEPREQHDREQLRLALEQRVAEWKSVLRSNPGQGRQVLHHVIGPIMLWLGDYADLAVADAADPRDRRGKKNLTAADVRWTAETRPSGLLAGMGVVQQMASPRGYVKGRQPATFVTGIAA